MSTNEVFLQIYLLFFFLKVLCWLCFEFIRFLTQYGLRGWCSNIFEVWLDVWWMFCSEVFAAFSSGGISKINRHVAMVVNMSGCFFLFLTHSVGLNPYTLLSLIICVMAATFNRNFFFPGNLSSVRWCFNSVRRVFRYSIYNSAATDILSAFSIFSWRWWCVITTVLRSSQVPESSSSWSTIRRSNDVQM